MNGEKQVTFKNVGVNDHIPYSKAEISKVCRISENFALSFYQIDYQAMALKMSAPNLLNQNSESNHLIPVGKIVLDRAAFMQFYAEITEIKNAVEAEAIK